MVRGETQSVVARLAALRADDGLASVMGEVAQIMGGCATALTEHPSSDYSSTILFVDQPASAECERAILKLAEPFGTQAADGIHAWKPCANCLGDEVLLIPVGTIAGHSRLVISVYFKRLTQARRRNVENIYLQRQPFAIGYFRLWQMNRVESRRCRVLESALHQTDSGVVFLGAAGELIFANDAAEVILAKGDGLRRSQGSVAATNMAESVSLQVALEHVERTNARARETNGQNSPVLALHRESGPPLILSLLAAETAAVEPSDVAVIMYIVDPQLNTAKMLAPVCRLYQLSRVETDLVCHLAQGRALAEAAEIMRIKEQTARSYMKQIYLKTETNRQTELVVLMLSSLVRMKDSIVQEALSVSVRMNGRLSEM